MPNSVLLRLLNERINVIGFHFLLTISPPIWNRLYRNQKDKLFKSFLGEGGWSQSWFMAMLKQADLSCEMLFQDQKTLQTSWEAASFPKEQSMCIQAHAHTHTHTRVQTHLFYKKHPRDKMEKKNLLRSLQRFSWVLCDHAFRRYVLDQNPPNFSP